jgi:L-iditol 2-dehydrogenase
VVKGTAGDIATSAVGEKDPGSMKAVRIDGPRMAGLVGVSRPRPAPGEVLVRVATAGICATDRKLLARGSVPPRVPGHEFAGWLEDGTPVGVHPDIGCGSCRHCRAGFENRCPRRSSVGLDRDGALAEWVAVPRRKAVAVEGIHAAIVAMLEPLACCLHAVSLLEVRPGTAALVVGAGSMGVLATWALQARGARVVVAQRSDARRRLAAELGADAAIGPDDDPAAALGEPPLVAIVTAPGPLPLDWALRRVDVGGRVHAFAGSPDASPVDANLVHYRQLGLVGSTGSTMRDYQDARSLVLDGTIPLDRLPRRAIALEQAVAALASATPEPALKTLVDIGRSAAP